MGQQDQQMTRDGIIAGLGFLVALHVLYIIILSGVLPPLLTAGFPKTFGDSHRLGRVWFGVFYGIGFTQLLYVIPACNYFRKQGYPTLAKGIIVGAALTALITSGSFLLAI